MKPILIIDDDQDLSELLSEYLSSEGFSIEAAYNGHDGLKKAQDGIYGLIILDIMLPNINGIELLKILRQQSINTPVLMLTAKGEDIDRILGLELGADDYVPKPCNPRELLARINAILRRTHHQEDPVSKQSIMIDNRRLEARYKDNALKLTGAEFKTLETLNNQIGKIITKEVLCEQALGRPLTRFDRSIDVHVSNLRKKLIEAGAHQDIIINQRGAGYLLKPE